MTLPYQEDQHDTNHKRIVVIWASILGQKEINIPRTIFNIPEID